MNNFTPIAAAIGGALIGLAAVLLMMLTGRVAGVSGIFGGLDGDAEPVFTRSRGNCALQHIDPKCQTKCFTSRRDQGSLQ